MLENDHFGAVFFIQWFYGMDIDLSNDLKKNKFF